MLHLKSTYEYDALYRLTKASGREHNSLANLSNNDFVNNIIGPEDGTNMRNYTQIYQYDELGNLLQMKSNGVWTRNYRYNFENNNYLLGHDLQSTMNEYTYDAHGNMTKMPHLQELKWDYEDNFKEVVLDANNNTAYYVYDAEGNRVRKVVVKGNIVEERFYVGDYEIYTKKTNGALDVERTSLHLTDDKAKIALIDYDTQSLTTTIRYQYTNHLDSANLELDETGAIISYEEYHPFGTTSYRSGRNETDVSLKRYKYVHKELDNETGLYYYGMRYYAPWIARFISVDPLQFKYPIYTPFQYAGNKPISYIDLDGAEEFRTTTGELIYRHKDNGVSYIVEDKYREHIDFTTKREEINKAYLDEAGQIQFSFKTTEEKHYYQYDNTNEGHLNEDSKEYQNLMKYARSNDVGNELIKMYIENDKQLRVEECVLCSFNRSDAAYKKITGKTFKELGQGFRATWFFNHKDAKKYGAPKRYFNKGNSGALVGYGLANKIINEDFDLYNDEIWGGALEPGAVLGFQKYFGWAGHSTIFLGYVFDDFTGKIVGINFWDQNAHGTIPYGTIYRDNKVEIRGANWSVFKQK